jgi:RNA polymerase sigma-70 factor (ECF subfamily)
MPLPEDFGAPDAELAAAAKNGDRCAFGTLIRRHQRRIFAIAMRFLGNQADAEDLVQETFLRAWRAIGSFEPERPFAPWLLKIASNRALTELEGRRRRPQEELSETLVARVPSPEEETERRRLEESLHVAVTALPEDQRMILLLRVMEGLSYRAIAATLDVPVGTVMSRLSRARETLRKRVRR